METERIRRQVNAEKQVQIELQKEISNLKAQLEESRQGLQAAARLSDQMEISKQQISNLKEEGNKLYFIHLHVRCVLTETFLVVLSTYVVC